MFERSGTTKDLYRGRRVALFTSWGTVVYFDAVSQTIRHGPAERHAVNVFLQPCGTQVERSNRALLACLVEGRVRLVSCTADSGVVTPFIEQQNDPNQADCSAFTFVPIDQDRIGLKSGGLFLCAEPDGRVTLSKAWLRDWEKLLVAVPGVMNPIRFVELPSHISQAISGARHGGLGDGVLTSVRHHTGARAIILCNLDWLRTYIASEHFHLIRILHEIHGFDILNVSQANFEDLGLLRRLNGYDAILVAYLFGVRVPMNRLWGYRIFRIDDLEVYNEKATQETKWLAQFADMLISPYAYDLPKFFPHSNTRWVPYSSAVEEDAERFAFNENPEAKILLSGSVAPDRPFRDYVFGLEDDRLVKLRHPGYGGSYDERSTEVVKRRWYETIRLYLCAFCDAHSLRYIHLRVFEIVSVGTLLLADRLVENEMNELGFIEGETCLFSDRDDFLSKVEWALDPRNRVDVDRIRRAGMSLALERHTTGRRAMELAAIVESVAMKKEA